jgi:hypothetical protein
MPVLKDLPTLNTLDILHSCPLIPLKGSPTPANPLWVSRPLLSSHPWHCPVQGPGISVPRYRSELSTTV